MVDLSQVFNSGEVCHKRMTGTGAGVLAEQACPASVKRT
jgi:hypothetical protein